MSYSSFFRKASIRSRYCASACIFFCEAVRCSCYSSYFCLLRRYCYICRYSYSNRYRSCSARLAFSRSSYSLSLRRYSYFILSAFSETTRLNSSYICLIFFSSCWILLSTAFSLIRSSRFTFLNYSTSPLLAAIFSLILDTLVLTKWITLANFYFSS